MTLLTSGARGTFCPSTAFLQNLHPVKLVNRLHSFDIMFCQEFMKCDRSKRSVAESHSAYISGITRLSTQTLHSLFTELQELLMLYSLSRQDNLSRGLIENLIRPCLAFYR